MHNNAKQALEEINDLSRQILSCITSMHDETIANTGPIANKTPVTQNSDDTTNEIELPEIVTKRQSLIHELFTLYSKDSISLEPLLLKEMTELDNQLSQLSLTYKKTLTEQVIKLKKSKKVKSSYNKY